MAGDAATVHHSAAASSYCTCGFYLQQLTATPGQRVTAHGGHFLPMMPTSYYKIATLVCPAVTGLNAAFTLDRSPVHYIAHTWRQMNLTGMCLDYGRKSENLQISKSRRRLQAKACLPGELFWARPTGTRPRGRPRIGWRARVSAGLGTPWRSPGRAGGSVQGDGSLFKLLPLNSYPASNKASEDGWMHGWGHCWNKTTEIT